MQANTGDVKPAMSSSSSSPSCSNNVVLETGDKYTLSDDGSELLIKSVKKVDEGDYTCIAKNKAGEKSEEVSLNVFGERITAIRLQKYKIGRGSYFPPWPFLYLLTFAVDSSSAVPAARCRAAQREAYSEKRAPLKNN